MNMNKHTLSASRLFMAGAVGIGLAAPLAASPVLQISDVAIMVVVVFLVCLAAVFVANNLT
jgi:hypothetical protein